MKLLVIIFCLLSERYLLHGISSQRFNWFPDYAKKILEVCGGHPLLKHPMALLACIVLPVFLIVGVLYFALCGLFYGFAGFVMSLIVLYYCFGTHNIFYPLTSDKDMQAPELVASYLADINTQVFALIFWYLIAGPMGALLYRLIALCRDIPELSSPATQVVNILEWLPARLMMLAFLFVGNFQKGFPYFMKHLSASPEQNTKIIGECGVLALASHEGDVLDLPTAERFMEYALIVFLVFIAIFTLAAWI